MWVHHCRVTISRNLEITKMGGFPSQILPLLPLFYQLFNFFSYNFRRWEVPQCESILTHFFLFFFFWNWDPFQSAFEYIVYVKLQGFLKQKLGHTICQK